MQEQGRRISRLENAGAEKTVQSLTPSPSKTREGSSPTPASAAAAVPPPARLYRHNQELRIPAANSENVFIVHNEARHKSFVHCRVAPRRQKCRKNLKFSDF